ncbi:MAG TPA: alpha/beta-hydrolase family protein [Mycobacteriales bacterium]
MSTAVEERLASRPEPGPATRPHPGRPAALVVATWFFLASITPSLIPHAWHLQGVASGLSAAYGYGLGLAGAWIWRRVRDHIGFRVTLAPVWSRRLRRGATIGGMAVVALIWLWSLQWQRETARLVQAPVPGPLRLVLGLVATVLVFVLVILAARGLRALVRQSSRLGQRFLRPWIATTLAAVLVTGLVLVLSNSVVYGRTMDYLAAKAAVANSRTPDGRMAPASPLRSGSPASAETWASLGRNGQAFVADGSSAAAITAATGRPAQEPIRVYAGLSGGRTLEQVAAAVVAELRRTGAFDRSVLALMTTTGRGWVDEWSASSIEYLTGGDSAVAAMQYSYLPSPVALVSDRRTPAAAGRILLSTVEAELAARPAGTRPRLVLGGESLGAYGGQAAFSGPDDMLARVDGAVWVGTPNFTPLVRTLTAERRRGSPEVVPVIGDGEHIRFASSPAELTRDLYGRAYGTWATPRVAYVQHASDPIARWSPSLLTTEPDWMREGAGTDLPEMNFTTFATFWQLTVDLMVAGTTPAGHGHRYHEELVPAWAGVLGLDPAADWSHVQQSIERNYHPV